MKILWVDTETTGLKSADSAPFQIAMIFEDTKTLTTVEKVFYLNPYDIAGIKHHKSAEAVHGYKKRQIEKFEVSRKVVPEIEAFLNECEQENPDVGLCFAAYNAPFDFEHLESLFSKYEIDFGKHFSGYPNIYFIDVLDQVKIAFEETTLFEGLSNKRLTTVAKHLGIKMDNAHDALCDIKTTREVSNILLKHGIGRTI